MNNLVKENERVDDLEYRGLKIIQNPEWFCFGMDSVLLSDFAKEIKKHSTIMDLGTGNGILSLLLSKKVDAKKVYGIELQEEVADMAKRSVKLNQLEEQIDIICEDIKNIPTIWQANSIDAIVTNPPYKKEQTGIINDNSQKKISRHETVAKLEDFISISAYVLKPKGTFYMVNRPERLADIIELLRKYELEPKNIQMVIPKTGKDPNLILIKAVKGGKDFLKVEKPLIIYKEDGSYTQEVLEIYGRGE